MGSARGGLIGVIENGGKGGGGVYGAFKKLKGPPW